MLYAVLSFLILVIILALSRLWMRLHPEQFAPGAPIASEPPAPVMGFMLGLALSGGGLAGLILTRNPVWISLVLAPPIAGNLVFLIRRFLIVRRFRRLLVNSNYLLCPCCQYRLTGLPGVGMCPECATPYDVALLRPSWET